MDAYPATQTYITQEKLSPPGIVKRLSAEEIARPKSPLEKLAQVGASPRTDKSLSINEYYQNSRPSQIMPGLKEQDFGYAAVSTGGFTFFGNEWEQYYTNNKDGKGNKMQEIFKSLDGKPISINGITYTFDFKKFNNYWASNKGRVTDVSFRGEFLTWRDVESQKVYAMPIPKGIEEKVKALGW